MWAACWWSMLKKFALKMRLAEMLLALKMRTEEIEYYGSALF
jgi:hypothetical protein